MKKTLFILLGALAFSGCARFGTKQTDVSYGEDGKPQRSITTKAGSYTFFDSKSQLSNWKANQTDKSQTAAVGSLSQEASSTNLSANIGAVTELLKALKP